MVAWRVRDVRAWLAVGALAGGVTITNGIKPILAWLLASDGWSFVRKMPRRAMVWAAAGTGGAVVLVAAFLMAKWTLADGPDPIQWTVITYHEALRYLPKGWTMSKHLWLAWNAFWREPMMLHEPIVGKSVMTVAYPMLIPHLVGALVLGLCVWSAVRNFAHPVIRAALAMVSFDVVLHVLVGWGLEEGQIYCGHWFWIVPLLVGLLPEKVALAAAALSATIASLNLFVIL